MQNVRPRIDVVLGDDLDRIYLLVFSPGGDVLEERTVKIPDMVSDAVHEERRDLMREHGLDEPWASSLATVLDDDALMERIQEIVDAPDCAMCESIEAGGGFGPRHDGSKHCESGSLASGGKNAHCTCDRCF